MNAPVSCSRSRMLPHPARRFPCRRRGLAGRGLHRAAGGGGILDAGRRVPGSRRTRPGSAYFLSAVLDEGAGPYASEAFHERLDEFAIELRFRPDRDALSGHLRTLVKHRSEAFDMLRLCLHEPRLDPEAMERVRAQIEAGIRHEMNDPDAMAGKAFFEARLSRPSLWPAGPWHPGEPADDHARRSRRLPQAPARARYAEDRRGGSHRRRQPCGGTRPRLRGPARKGAARRRAERRPPGHRHAQDRGLRRSRSPRCVTARPASPARIRIGSPRSS